MKLSLPNNELHLWFVEQADFAHDELLDECSTWLSTNDKARYERFQFESHRKELLLGKVLMRSVLSEYSDVNPQDWTFTENEWGRPQLGSGHENENLFFSLSHSSDRMVLAVSRHQSTGVDIEASLRKRRIARIADRYFSSKEVEKLLEREEDRQHSRFYELWTLKEAYIKARGMGLALPLQEFGFDFESQSKLNFWVNPVLDDAAKDWQFWQIDSGESFKLALAVKSENSEQVAVINAYQKTAVASYISTNCRILRQS